jgi:hypothetical protein
MPAPAQSNKIVYAAAQALGPEGSRCFLAKAFTCPANGRVTTVRSASAISVQFQHKLSLESFVQAKINL